VGKVQDAEGRSSCDECSFVSEYIKRTADDACVQYETDVVLVGLGKPADVHRCMHTDNKTCVKCPEVGASCDGNFKRYKGGVWHNSSIVNPTESTKMYSCVTEGCPDAGALEMKCKPGFAPAAPLCAVCAEGYWKQLRDCFPCEKPKMGWMAGMLVAGLVAVFIVYRFLRKYHRFLLHSNIIPHAKILISFVMVAGTVDTQFGEWAPSAVIDIDL
jgi:hypothetical protein